MDKQDYEILCTMVASKERPPEYAVKLLEDTCAKTGLDWKLRHLYLMQKGAKWMVTLSIDGFRLTGSQDPDYGGQDGPYWVTDVGGSWSDIPPDGKVYAAKVGIKHRNGVTTWGVAKFADYKAGPMWDKFPSTMSAKCAEMLAWRKAFPGRLGGMYGAEEMAQSTKAVQGLVETVTDAQDIADLVAHYQKRIAETRLVDELKGLGRLIMGDSRLTETQTLPLSVAYEARKAVLIRELPL